MKKIWLAIVVAALTITPLLIPTRSAAQKTGDWIPENGFWEVISNDNDRRQATVRFYDLAGHLVYTEHLTGITIDVKKKKTCRVLNETLQTALAAAGYRGAGNWPILTVRQQFKK
jgi:hypothetical protein